MYVCMYVCKMLTLVKVFADIRGDESSATLKCSTLFVDINLYKGSLGS